LVILSKGADAPLKYPTELVSSKRGERPWRDFVAPEEVYPQQEGGNKREGAKPQIHYREFKRDGSPSSEKIFPFPLSRGRGYRGWGSKN